MYQKIIDKVSDLRKTGFEIPHVVVITDIGKDYDDLAAMIVLKELHRLGAIKLEGFIANLVPEDERAHLARKALDLLGLQDIPVGEGTEGTDEEIPRHVYEFPHSVMGEKPYPAQHRGLDLLQHLRRNAEKGGYKLTFLLISSLRDISKFEKLLRPVNPSQSHPLKHITAKVVLQGLYKLEDNPEYDPNKHSHRSILKADVTAANNKFDWPGAQSFHAFLDREDIPSVVYTKTAAYETPLRPTIFADMAKTGHTLGDALHRIEGPQNTMFYEGSCRMTNGQPDPVWPLRDQQWFLKRRTNYFDNHKHELNRQNLPAGDQILNYCQVIVYDALAALGTCPEVILDKLDVLQIPNFETQSVHSKLHRIVGVTPKKDLDTATPKEYDASRNNPDYKSKASTNSKNMKNVIEALLMGALLDCKAKGIGMGKA